jgi:hypothetical protein
VEVAERKVGLVPRLSRSNIYFSAGVVVAALYYAVDNREEVRRDVDKVVERALNFILARLRRSVASRSHPIC